MTTDMATAAARAPGIDFETWRDGISQAPGDPAWHYWDSEILLAVDAYNRHLAATAGYRPLSWTLIKAMLWVDTGAGHGEWRTRPMQIGSRGDKSLTTFLSGKEGGELIIPPAWKLLLLSGAVRNRPEYTLRAGIGYLLMRMANFSHQSIAAPDSKVFDVTVKPGDSIAKIARQQSSTPDALLALNPQINPALLRPGQVLKCRKASLRRTITGWRTINADAIARDVNRAGDPHYARKLRYALEMIEKGRDAPRR